MEAYGSGIKDLLPHTLSRRAAALGVAEWSSRRGLWAAANVHSQRTLVSHVLSWVTFSCSNSSSNTVAATCAHLPGRSTDWLHHLAASSQPNRICISGRFPHVFPSVAFSFVFSLHGLHRIYVFLTGCICVQYAFLAPFLTVLLIKGIFTVYTGAFLLLLCNVRGEDILLFQLTVSISAKPTVMRDGNCKEEPQTP